MADLLEDGTADWGLGQDAWHDPDRLQEGQYASGVNVTTKGRVLSPRPGFHQRQLVFEREFILSPAKHSRLAEEVWTSGKFQAAIPYRQDNDDYVITVISGYIFRTNIATYKTRLLSTTVRCDQYTPRLNWSYASGDIVICDYPDYPIIISGEEVKRSDPKHKLGGVWMPQVPIATACAYNHNRLFVANAGVEFTAGDAVGNKATPEAPLTFTEVFTPNSDFVNQVFALPVEEAMYPITAMGFIQTLDTSTGIGPLFIATEKKVYTYAANQPRSQWGQGQFGSVLLANTGLPGQRSFVNVNSDLVFVSSDGKVRALSSARNDAKKWSNVSISREVENYLKVREPELSRYAVTGYAKNTIFISANPYRVQALDLDKRPVADYAHGGFVVLEIDNSASMLAEGSPVWAGLWTGVNPVEIFSVGERTFVVSKDGSGKDASNALYEVNFDSTYDIVGGAIRQITSVVTTREYIFKSEFVDKHEGIISLMMQNLKGNIELKIERKPRHSSRWLLHSKWNHIAPSGTLDFPDDIFGSGYAGHAIKDMVFGDPLQEGWHPVTSDPYSIFKAMQYRFTISAESWILSSFRTTAMMVPVEERNQMCDSYPVVAIAQDESPDWFIPGADLCLK